MMEAALRHAGEEEIRTIAAQTYAQWQGRGTTKPPALPHTNARTRREMRLLTVWGWDAP